MQKIGHLKSLGMITLLSPKVDNVIRILHVDDDICLLKAAKKKLSMEKNFEIDIATSVAEALKKMEATKYDVIISDYEMPKKNGLEFLKEMQSKNIQIPFILFTKKSREDVAVKALNLGADRFINTNGSPEIVYSELSDAIKKTVEQKKSLQLLAASETKYRMLVNNSLQGILILKVSPFRIVFGNSAIVKILGYSLDELMSFSAKQIMELVHFEDRESYFNRLEKRLKCEQAKSCFEFRAVRKDGSTIWLEAISNRVEYEGQIALQALFLDITESKKDRDVLRESERRYRELANFLPEIVFETDLSGKITFFSQRAFEISGFSQEELEKGMNMLSFVVPQDNERAKENIKKALTGAEREWHEYTLYKKNGATYPAIVKTAPIISENKVTGLRSLVIDITDRKKADIALRESEEKYRLIVELSHEGIIALDPNDNIIFVNPRITKSLGFSEDVMVGKSLFCFVPERGFAHATHYLNYSREGVSGEFELELNRRDGQTINALFSSSIIKDEKGRYIGNFAMVSDITVRKKMEENLMQERENLENVTENIGAGLTLISKDYTIRWANKFLTELNGPLENKICYSTFNTLTEICQNCGVQKVFNGAPSDTREYFNRELFEKGLPSWFEIIATPVKDKSGAIVSALELTIDITEKKRMQAQLLEYSQKLEKTVEERTNQLHQTQAKLLNSERLAAIGELAGMVGHDLRNPLAGIKNACYFLKKKGITISEVQAQEMYETIDNAINYSNHIINDLLDYSREMKLKFIRYSVSSVVEETFRIIQIPDRIQIVSHIQQDTWIWVDFEKIIRVFTNIIKNAIDAIPEKGTIEITSRQTKTHVEIVFADTGQGISEETLQKLFTPLFTTKAQGMGFGLAICKRIIDAHEGSITIKTALNKGTSLTITLPNDLTTSLSQTQTLD
jgi:PAS domain S-box-containing protein